MVAATDNPPGQDTEDTTCNSVSLLLEQGDQIRLQLIENRRVYTDSLRRNTFSGHLLFAMWSFWRGRENVDLVFLVDHSLILKLQCVNVKKCNCFLCRNLQILLILINTPVRECVVFGRWISLTDPWQINFRDILLIIISRGTNNCPTCIWEKHFIMIPPPPPRPN